MNIRRIALNHAPVKPSVAQAEDIVRQASEQLGESWQVARAGNRWVFRKLDDKGSVADCHVSRRLFMGAMAQAMNATIVNTVDA